MSKPDDKQTEFHAVVVTPRIEIEYSKVGNVISYKQDRQAEELGRLIAQTKGWRTDYVDNNHYSHLDLFVYTKTELHDLVDALFKERLQQMADNSQNNFTDEQRDALRLAAERY